jgi:hypothetical protein
LVSFIKSFFNKGVTTMTEEQKLEEETVEKTEKVETAAVETEKAEQKTEYKHTDYEYKSWSSGVPTTPDGWERCPGYSDVIRRLKPVSPKPEDKPAKTTPKTASCQMEAGEDVFAESWNKPQGGCCC